LGPPVPSDEDLQARTVEQFCRASRSAGALLYDIWSRGEGPRFFKLGSSKRISRQAGDDWISQLEQATPQAPIDNEAVLRRDTRHAARARGSGYPKQRTWVNSTASNSMPT
jgi:hypothetical protein